MFWPRSLPILWQRKIICGVYFYLWSPVLRYFNEKKLSKLVNPQHVLPALFLPQIWWRNHYFNGRTVPLSLAYHLITFSLDRFWLYLATLLALCYKTLQIQIKITNRIESQWSYHITIGFADVSITIGWLLLAGLCLRR